MTAGGTRTRFWIDTALECIRRDHTSSKPGLDPFLDQGGPFLSARALGLALAALHDVKALAAGAKPILNLPTAISATGPITGLKTAEEIDLAAAAACYAILLKRYQNQSPELNRAWDNWIEFFGFETALMDPSKVAAIKQAGIRYGEAVEHLGNGDEELASTNSYVPSFAPYTHQSAPNPDGTPGNQTFAGSSWGKAKHLVLGSHLTFATPPKPVNGSTEDERKHYQTDFGWVARKGQFNRDTVITDRRSLKEEFIGIYWGYDGSQEIGTPPRLYMQVVLTILDGVQARQPGRLSELDEIMIIAAIAVAMADAGIEAWHFKYSPDHMMWRPVVGIRQAENGNGSRDPNWLPLGLPATNTSKLAGTPNFPAYPSGHATFGAAAFQLLRLFLVDKGVSRFLSNGLDDMKFTFVSDEFNGRNKEPRDGKPRDLVSATFGSLWEAIIKNSISRVFLGVHWQFDGVTKRNASDTGDEFGVPEAPNELGRTGGVWLGCQIANTIAARLGISAGTITTSGVD